MTAPHEDSTVLSLGARGRLRGEGFELVGRTCVRSAAGGLWNEWTMRFAGGAAAFLAEARGTFSVFREQALAPAFDALTVGEPLDTGFVVVERGKATRVATWGETLDAPRSYRYADLSSRTGESATIDYGETPPTVFVGERTTLKALGLRPRDARPRFLAAPKGPRARALDPVLAVGDEGVLDDVRWRVIAVLERSIRDDGKRFTWQEHLLHDPTAGLRWLVVSDGHWNLVEMVEPGLVHDDEEKATYEGVEYRFVSGGRARLDWAEGELPWDASLGDEAEVADFVHAPHVLSFEGSDDEIAWSRGTYVPPEMIARAFGKRVLPKPIGRAPNQPRKTQPSRR